nr:unnamed protein product [Callosobruchus analis]
MEGALKVQLKQVSEVKPVKASTSKMEWHAQATIREGSVILWIPETDDDNFIAVKKRKTYRAPTSSAPTHVKTTNTFGVLTNTSNITKPRVPPIIITGEIGEYKTFINKIRSIIQSDNFNVKFNKNNAKVSISDIENFDVLRKELINSKTPHHTYTKEEDKVKRIVMKAAPNMDLDDIKVDLLKKNIMLTNCTPLVGRGNNSYSYLLSLQRNVNIQNVKKVDAVSNIKVQ